MKKKYFEEAHFSVKPHNSITNEEFVSQKTDLVFSSPLPHNLINRDLLKLKRTAGHQALSKGAICQDWSSIWRVYPGQPQRAKLNYILRYVALSL